MIFFRIFLLLAFVLSLGFCKKKDDDKNKKNLLLGAVLLTQNQRTLTPGGTICTGAADGNYYSFADGLISAAAFSMGLSFQKKATAGSIENATSIASGTCNMAIVQEDSFRKLQIDGATNNTYLKAAGKMNIIASLYPEDVQLLVNKNSNITSISDMVGKKVNIGPDGSGTQVTANIILATYGFTDSSKPVYSTLSVSDSISKVASGEIDAAFIVSAAPTPSISALPSTANVKLIAAKFKDGTDKYIYTHDGVIRSGTYSWHTADLSSNIKVRSLLVVSHDFDDSKIESFLGAIYDNTASFTSYNANWKNVSRGNSKDFFGNSPYQWNYKAAAYSIGTEKKSSALSKICSGSTSGTYTLIAQDLIPVITNKVGVTVTETNTTGSLENAFKLRDGDCAFGIVQEDTFRYLETYSTNDYRIASPAMKKLMVLYYEDVHVLVNTNSGINSISDFSGKKINLGEKTSGNFVTAKNIVNSYTFATQPTYYFDDRDTSVDKVVAGTIDATILVGSAPISKLAGLSATSPVKLILATTNSVNNAYDANGVIKGTVSAGTYPWHTTDLKSNLRVSSILVKSAFGVSDTSSAAFVKEIYSQISSGGFTKASSAWSQVNSTGTNEFLKKYPFSFSPAVFDYFIQ